MHDYLKAYWIIQFKFNFYAETMLSLVAKFLGRMPPSQFYLIVGNVTENKTELEHTFVL